MRIVDIQNGQQFGKLTVVREVEQRNRRRAVECQCECGNIKTVLICNIRRGLTISCGCHQKQMAIKAQVKHGESRHGVALTAEFSIWRGMWARCRDKSHPQYGGRGISICDRWKHYRNFLEDMGRRPTEDHSIDRIDNNGDYTPENCRWATDVEQARNRSNSVFVELYGKRMHVEEWSHISGVSGTVIRDRLRKGWTSKKAVWIPIGQHGAGTVK